MFNTTVHAIDSAAITRDEAIAAFKGAADKTMNSLTALSPAANVYPRRIVDTLKKNLYDNVVLTLVDVDDVTYEDMLNGTKQDLRAYITAATNLVNTMRDKTVGERCLHKSAYMAGFKLIEQVGVTDKFVHTMEWCFDSPTLKPFFVAGCMSYVKNVIKEHREGHIEKNCTITNGFYRNYKHERMTAIPTPAISDKPGVQPAKAPAPKPDHIPSRPVSYPAKPNASTISAPTL